MSVVGTHYGISKRGGFLPCLVPYPSSSDSDDSYVIPVMKSRMVCSAIGSDQDEVSFGGSDEENYIPSFSSGSDSTDDYVGEEDPAPKVLPLSGVKVCRTNKQGVGLGVKKTARKMNKYTVSYIVYLPQIIMNVLKTCQPAKLILKYVRRLMKLQAA